ncbi:glycosyltransferase [Pseudorhodoferax soli]|uniref:Glycosyl transferase family 2 n=1 Tax=Pseudorhodoferax soli TaxID=545864 RepID=A0A368YB20_9BURK|nr:glycosyltransferase family A protein [Pseudorhodoferax soli]RCW76037.1 glycosyl transferase family 2 [Pseudorhodoferax soli]
MERAVVARCGGISVIVPTYRDGHAAVQTADAIRTLLREGDELLIIDNGSEAEHVQVCQAFANRHAWTPIRILVCGQRGSYAARNLGVEHAQGEILAFTDAGCLPAASWLSAVRDHFATRDESRVTGPIEMTYAGAHPSLVELVDARMHLNQDGYAAQGWAATANLAIRRDALLALGGFDPTLHSGGDVEFGMRAMASGHQIGWSSAMVVRHQARATVQELLTKRRRVRAGHRQLAARPGFAEVVQHATQASARVQLDATERNYPGVSGLRWQLGRVAVRLLREYEKLFGAEP